MRVLFVAKLGNPSASGHQRLWALRQHAQWVGAIDISAYRPAFPSITGKLAKLCRRPEWLCRRKALSETVLDACVKEKPDVVWIEWPREFSPETIRAIRQAAPSAKLVSFQDDNPWGDRSGDVWQWKSYFAVAPLFDAHLVKRDSDIDNLRRLGGVNCLKWRHGVYPPLFGLPAESAERPLPVVLVATCMDGRHRLAERLLEAGVPLRVFGEHWARRTTLPQRFPEAFHGAVEGEAYTHVLQQAKIGLGIVSSSNHDEWTMRSYEIPSCGAAFLGARTPTHNEMYEEGKEAEFFADDEECLDKVTGLLRDEPRRQSIALAGHNRCVAMGDLADRAKEALEQLDQL